MKWQEIPKVAQWIVVVIGAVVALSTTCWAAYSHFQTDIEANASHAAIRSVVAQNQQHQLDVFKQDRVDRHQREIDRIEYQLISEDLTPEQREYLTSKREELRELIKCIRLDNC